MIEIVIGWVVLIAIGVVGLWLISKLMKTVNKWLILSPLLLPIIVAIVIFAFWFYLKYTGAIS